MTSTEKIKPVKNLIVELADYICDVYGADIAADQFDYVTDRLKEYARKCSLESLGYSEGEAYRLCKKIETRTK